MYVLCFKQKGFITSLLAVFNDIAIQAPSSNPLWGEPLQAARVVCHIMHCQTRWLASWG